VLLLQKQQELVNSLTLQVDQKVVGVEEVVAEAEEVALQILPQVIREMKAETTVVAEFPQMLLPEEGKSEIPGLRCFGEILRILKSKELQKELRFIL
jgi:hypothetical protein